MERDSRQAIAHLYRRAGFGLRSDELDVATSLGFENNVERLVVPNGQDPGADAVLEPKPKDGRVGLVGWWLRRMVAAERPLWERLAFFWHGHFATSIAKVERPAAMLQQNKSLRSAGWGDYRNLVLTVARDPAMLLWLDSNTNVKGKPNENFARELMELFTLGTGSYTERDVSEAARCFTGWRVGAQGGFYVDDRLHDHGAKTVLGRTGDLGGEDVIDLVTSHPAGAPFIVSKLWSHFVTPRPPTDPVVRELGRGFAADGSIVKLVRNLFMHPAFLSDEARFGLVRSPTVWMAALHRALRVAVEPHQATWALMQHGQVPFEPPSVAGWPANEAWLTTASAHSRAGYAMAIAGRAKLDFVAKAPEAERPSRAAELLGVDGWGRATAEALAGLRREPVRLVALAAVSPEFLVC